VAAQGGKIGRLSNIATRYAGVHNLYTINPFVQCNHIHYNIFYFYPREEGSNSITLYR